jgi:phage-related protein
MGSIYNTAGFVGGTTYKKNAVVTSGGKNWYALQEHSNGTAPAIGSLFWNGNINITIDGTTTVNPYFFWAPSYNVQVSHSPRIKSLQFGDGYEQRMKDGINNNPLNLSLSFESRTETEAAAILHFLHSREGFGTFYFKVPPPYSLIKKFVCKTFSSNFVFADNYTVQCSFLEIS